MLINGIKFACNTCVKGHRSSNCNHIERPLFEIRKKGRPVTQCAFCRDLRKTRQIHIKCTCTDKTKNIENTAIQCYQCPSSSTKVIEEQGISYSDLIQTSIHNKPKDSSIQCTCHEAANKILLQQQEQYTWSHQDNNTPILPVRPRGIMIEESSPGFSYSKSSLRFLGGQTKSPRRRSSASSNKRRLSSHHSNLQHDDMQTFLFNNQQHQKSTTTTSTELDPECNLAFPSNSSTTTSSTSTPNSFTNTSLNFNDPPYNENNDINFMMNTTNPDELTSLLNNVLNEKEQEDHVTNQIMSVDMARSPTTNSFSSSSSTNAFIIPPFQQPPPPPPIQSTVCGSFTSHSNCSPAMDTQGESVVITITPLSTLFTSNEERLYKNSQGKPVTRIVTCYCGNACICPGCFVHPNNYLLQQQQQQLTMQQLQQQQYFMQQQQLSSNSSSYSSDDEDQHHMNHTNYSLL